MQIRELLGLVKSSTGRRWVARTARERLSSRQSSIGVRRDMSVPFTPPPAAIPLVLRNVQPDDDLSFIADEPGLPAEAAQHRADQRWLLESDLPTCWVAVDSDGVVRYMAWLLMARDNPLVRARWGDRFPELKPDEALIEGVYVSTGHRRLGVMTGASCAIADRAVELGVRYVMGFIGEHNTASLRSAEKAGFTPFVVRTERWVGFRRHVRFEPVADLLTYRSAAR